MEHCPDPSNELNTTLRRSLFRIIWSCATTLFACTYVSIHRDVSLNESFMTAIKRKAAFMATMIILPEFIIMWAVEQYTLAAALSFIHRDSKGWTKTHAFFMIMGGFCTEGRHHDMASTLSYNELAKDNQYEWPTADIVREAEIEDRGKADFLTKLIVIGQTLWFCVQFITRLVLHLDTTQLELVTFAYAVVNFFLSILWWYKPFEVHSQIGMKRLDNPHKPSNGVPPVDEFGQGRADMDDSFEPPPQGLGGPWRTLRYLRRAISNPTIWPIAIAHNRLIHPTPLPDITLIQLADCRPKNGVAVLEFHLVKTLFHSLGLYDRRSKFSERVANPLLYLGIIFGGLHLIAWPFTFPTVAEQWMWRTSSIGLVAAAVFIAMMDIIGTMSENLSGDGWITVILTWTLLALIIVGQIAPLCYVIARALTLFLPLFELRRLPCGAFKEIDWVEMIPHF